MRELEFLEDEDEISRDIFDMLLDRSYSKPLCPRLLKLSWTADPVFCADFTPFLSPQLQDVHLVAGPGTLFTFPHAISALPITSLKSLRLSIIGNAPVREAIASMFKNISKSLTTLKISQMDQLQDGSWYRILFFLPCLRSLETDQWPPSAFPPRMPVFFPSLRQISLRGFAASRWIQFLAEDRIQKVSTDTGFQPRRVAPHLVQLRCDYVSDLDATFISHLRVFRNLSILLLGTNCSRVTRCTFHLTDDDVTQLAIELPGLRELSLGFPCEFNTCRTTVISLLALSTYCRGLRQLCIHFSTRNLAHDMRQSLRHPLRHNQYPPSRCPLEVLDVVVAPLTGAALGEEMFPIIAGLVDIFPRLQRIWHLELGTRSSWRWQQLSAYVPIFQQMRRSLPAVFIQ